MADRLGGIAVVRVPLRRSPMQYRRPLWCRAGQLMPQQAAEQVVIPEPAVLVVQRDQEQVGTMYFADQFCAVGPSRELVAQRRAHTVEDGGHQEELTHQGGLARQHLVAEIVDDVPVRAGETLDKGRRVSPAAQPQGRQLQACGPSLGPRQQPEHVPLRQLRLEPVTEEFPCLAGAEPEIFGPQLGHITAHSEPAERQRRVGPGDEHEVQLRWGMAEQRRDRCVHLGTGDEVVIVQHENQGSVR